MCFLTKINRLTLTCSICFLHSLLANHTLIFRDAGDAEHLKEFIDTLRNNETFMEKFVKLHNFAQVLHLESRTNQSKHLLIVNTHLYSQIEAGSIRFVQMVCTLKHIEYIYRTIKQDRDDIDVAIIICGDLNSVPEQNINKFALNGALPERQYVFETSE